MDDKMRWKLIEICLFFKDARGEMDKYFSCLKLSENRILLFKFVKEDGGFDFSSSSQAIKDEINDDIETAERGNLLNLSYVISKEDMEFDELIIKYNNNLATSTLYTLRDILKKWIILSHLSEMYKNSPPHRASKETMEEIFFELQKQRGILDNFYKSLFYFISVYDTLGLMNEASMEWEAYNRVIGEVKRLYSSLPLNEDKE